MILAEIADMTFFTICLTDETASSSSFQVSEDPSEVCASNQSDVEDLLDSIEDKLREREAYDAIFTFLSGPENPRRYPPGEKSCHIDFAL